MLFDECNFAETPHPWIRQICKLLSHLSILPDILQLCDETESAEVSFRLSTYERPHGILIFTCESYGDDI